MELEVLNEEYNYLKFNLKGCKDNITYLEDQLKELEDDKKIYEGNLILAKRENDNIKIEQTQADIKKLNDKVKSIKEQANKNKNKMAGIQQRLDLKIEEIRNNPEIKEQIDTALDTRYERRLNKAIKDKDEAIKNEEKIANLRELITNHPALQNNVKGILTASATVKNLNKELKEIENLPIEGKPKYSNPEKADDLQVKIQEARDKANKNFGIIKDFARKNGMKVADIYDALKMIMGNGIVLESKDPNNISANVMASIEKNEKLLNKQIKKYDNQIEMYNVLLRKQEPIQEIPQEENIEKPKWYQFIKRFKAWNYKRQQRKLPESSNNSIQEPQENQEPQNDAMDEKKRFSNDLKWDIVRDTMELQQSEEIKNAKEVVKEEKNDKYEEQENSEER